MWACSGDIVVERDECVADVVDGGTKREKRRGINANSNPCGLTSEQICQILK